MNQTHTGLREDAAKKRRKYLRNIGTTYTLLGVFGIASIAGVLFVLMTLTDIWFAVTGSGHRALLVPELQSDGGLMGSEVGISASDLLDRFSPYVVGGLYATIAAIFCVKSAKTYAKAIPYIPRNAEQLAALPADEVLLRGSDTPTAPDELLRASHEGGDQASEELLRAGTRISE